MNSRLVKKLTRHFLFFVCALGLCGLLSGCLLIDLINKFILENYRTSSKISILVYPPFPHMQKKEYDDMDKLITAFSASEGVKKGLMNGVAQFNQASSVEIIPIFYNKIEPVLKFYDNIFKNIEDSTKIKRICRNKIFDIRDNTEYKTASCIIFGVFEYKDTAEAYNITLCYYDYANDKWTQVSGVVSKYAGRVQESDLQNLMKTLLKRVYD